MWGIATFPRPRCNRLNANVKLEAITLLSIRLWQYQDTHQYTGVPIYLFLSFLLLHHSRSLVLSLASSQGSCRQARPARTRVHCTSLERAYRKSMCLVKIYSQLHCTATWKCITSLLSLLARIIALKVHFCDPDFRGWYPGNCSSYGPQTKTNRKRSFPLYHRLLGLASWWKNEGVSSVFVAAFFCCSTKMVLQDATEQHTWPIFFVQNTWNT